MIKAIKIINKIQKYPQIKCHSPTTIIQNQFINLKSQGLPQINNLVTNSNIKSKKG